MERIPGTSKIKYPYSVPSASVISSQLLPSLLRAMRREVVIDGWMPSPFTTVLTA